MSTEVDPLLPKNESSPEISGYGFQKRAWYSFGQKKSEEIHDENGGRQYGDDEEDARSTRSFATSTKSAMSTLCSIFSIVVFFALILSLQSVDWNKPWQNPLPTPPKHDDQLSLRVRALKILDNTPLIDGHNDLAIFLRFAYKNKIHTSSFQAKFENGSMEEQVDLPRLKSGHAGGAFWSAFVPCPANASGDFSDSNYAEAVSTTLSQIDLLLRIQDQYRETFTPATDSVSVALTHWYNTKRLFSPISIEGLHQVPQSEPFATIRLYSALGVRAATLTWNCHNAFADAALITESKDGNFVTYPAPYYRGGLTDRGRAVLREMNRLGMLIDISHTSYWTQRAVLSNSTSLAPVIFSHSSAYTLCPHPRNVQDDILDLVKQTGSLVMINFTPEFISCLPAKDNNSLPELYRPNNTLHQVARHIVYVGEKIGYEHVGLGSDFDGMSHGPPRGLEAGVGAYPDLVEELLRMNVSDADAQKVVGDNIINVWKKAEALGIELRRQKLREGEDEVLKWGSDGIALARKTEF